MQTYNAPLRDMRFVLHELHGYDRLNKYPKFADATPDLIDSVLEEAAKLATEVILPTNMVGDQEGCVLENGVVRTPTGYKQAYDTFRDGGWPSLAFDPEWGGQGLPESVSQDGRGDAVGRKRGLRSLSGPDPGGHPGAAVPRQPRAEADLHAQDGRGGVVRGHVSDRGALRHRSRPAAHQGHAERRWQLPPGRVEDIHLRRRARPDREHHPPGVGQAARRAVGHPGHQPVRRPQVHPHRGRPPGPAQRRGLHRHRAQDGTEGVRHLPADLRGRHGLAGGRAQQGHGRHVHHDERRAPRRGHPGAGRRRGRLPGRRRLRQGPFAGPLAVRDQAPRPAGRSDHRPPGRAAHADDHARLRRGLPRRRRLGRPGHGRGRGQRRPCREADRRRLRRPDDAGGEGAVHRHGLGSRQPRGPGLWRPWLHPRARGGAVRPRRPHRPALRGHQRHPGHGPGRPQGGRAHGPLPARLSSTRSRTSSRRTGTTLRSARW